MSRPDGWRAFPSSTNRANSQIASLATHWAPAPGLPTVKRGNLSQGSSWPRTSPPLFWLVWTLTYVLPALNSFNCAAVNLAPVGVM